MERLVAVLLGLLCVAAAAPVADNAPVVQSMDLSLTVFDQNTAKKADQGKNYVILAFDTNSCAGDKQAHCKELETALNSVVSEKIKNTGFDKYKSSLSFGKANKDDFPDHKKDFEKAKVPLPAILFWPSGHSRPSCKFDIANPTGEKMGDWLLSKLKEEDDDDLLQLDEGEDTPADARIEDASLLVCQADGGPNVIAKDDVTCSDLMEGNNLVQVERTQKVWDFKKAEQKMIGPADNSLPHPVAELEGTIKAVDSQVYQDLSKAGKWTGLYFYAPWCHYCECLDPVWNGVAGNLITSQRQPDLVLGKVDGDANPELRNLLNVTVYPTFLLINREGDKVLGRYLGPRKVFELSNWVEDLIVAAENPVVKHQFESSDEGTHMDLHPVYPYEGAKAFGGDANQAVAAQALASVSAELTLGGNEFDECVDSDEAKFTAPGAALLVHYSSERELEMDGSIVNTDKVPEKLTVIDFYAPWCPHCQKLNPVWDTVAAKTGQEVVVGKVDVENHPEVKRQFGIHRFPTIMYFEPGSKMSFDEGRRYVGQRDVDHLTKWIDGLKSSHQPQQAAAAVAVPAPQQAVPAPQQAVPAPQPNQATVKAFP